MKKYKQQTGFIISSEHQSVFSDPETLADALKNFSSHKQCSLIGVSGFGGAGKTTLCREISYALPDQAFHFSCDLFAKYGTVERRQRIADALASNDPDRIEAEENPKNWYAWEDIEKTLNNLKDAGSCTFSQGWNQETGERDKESVFRLPDHDYPIVLVDCIYLLHPPVRSWFDLLVYVDTPLDVTFERGEQRDRHRSDPDYLEYKRHLTRKYCVPYFEAYTAETDWVYRATP